MRRVRLTEGQLHRIIRNAVNEAIKNEKFKKGQMDFDWDNEDIDNRNMDADYRNKLNNDYDNPYNVDSDEWKDNYDKMAADDDRLTDLQIYHHLGNKGLGDYGNPSNLHKTPRQSRHSTPISYDTIKGNNGYDKYAETQKMKQGLKTLNSQPVDKSLAAYVFDDMHYFDNSEREEVSRYAPSYMYAIGTISPGYILYFNNKTEKFGIDTEGDYFFG